MNAFIKKMVLEFVEPQLACRTLDDVLSIADRKGFSCFTYEQMAEKTRLQAWYIKANYDPDGFVFWSERDQRFIICYNVEQPENEIKWTIVHEMAHIALGHLTKERLLCRSAFPKPQARVLFEVEAQKFTGMFFQEAGKRV